MMQVETDRGDFLVSDWLDEIAPPPVELRPEELGDDTEAAWWAEDYRIETTAAGRVERSWS